MSEKVISESVLINRPQQDTWDYITTFEHWKNWYVEGLTDVSPRWQKGATLTFVSGQKAVITQCASPNLVQWGDKTSLRLSKIDSSSTEVEYSITVRGMFAEDPMLLAEFENSFFNDVGSMLKKLKNLLES
jgi:hypothetical protein